MKNLITITLLLLVTACSEDNIAQSDKKTTPKNDHIWKAQTDALQQTKDLAEQLNEQFKQKEKQLQQAKE
ncbi:hypothetical protein MNBD_GAMMA22-423 [hydrothermal vent metagenome]|uniref:Lipoprotein n=1 Tax=hydrothermal vent metagenome TaxID=652676 RepID=A0A3B1A8Q0_9ZZZZ